MSFALSFIDYLAFLFLKTFPSFPNYIVQGFVMIMPTVGYMDQIRMMCSTKDPTIYSMNSALVLISSSTMKVIFYKDQPFGVTVLGQAIALLIVAYVHTYFHFKYLYEDEKKEENKLLRKNRFRLFNILKKSITDPVKACRITSSTNFEQFLTSCFFYTATFLIAYYTSGLFVGLYSAASFCSFVVSLIDSTVSLPTFKLVVIQGNWEKTSIVLMGQYLFGDIFKIVIFEMSHSPWPFVFGGVLQLVIDSISSVRYLMLMFKKPSVDETLSGETKENHANVIFPEVQHSDEDN